MSYILDALRKSETERRQGKIPDLGQQVQLIHRPKKRRISPVVWVALALLVNAGVLAVVFWPETEIPLVTSTKVAATPAPIAGSDVKSEVKSEVKAKEAVVSESEPEPAPIPEPEPAIAEAVRERPTIITPSVWPERQTPVLPQDEHRADEHRTRVPHLVELPLSFQKSIPDLMFNSHIYSSDPYASRVMINGHYLRRGESFLGMTVEEITKNGVVLGKQGKTFRIGTVRDWVSPN